MPHFVRSLLMGLASVWALLPSAHANLVVNGSFEDDLAGWSASGAVLLSPGTYELGSCAKNFSGLVADQVSSTSGWVQVTVASGP